MAEKLQIEVKYMARYMHIRHLYFVTFRLLVVDCDSVTFRLLVVNCDSGNICAGCSSLWPCPVAWWCIHAIMHMHMSLFRMR